MVKNSSDLIVILTPNNPSVGILALDVAGRPFIDYLAENATSVPGVAVRGILFNNNDKLCNSVAARNDLDWQVWSTGMSLDEVLGYPSREGVLLLIDAGVSMFSSLAMENLLARTRRHSGCLQVFESAGVDGDACMIAQAVSGEKEWSTMLAVESEYDGIDLDRLRHVSSPRESGVIWAKDIDPANPPGIIRDLVAMAREERRILRQRATAVMRQGVRIRDPEKVEIRGVLQCGADVEIDINVIIEGEVSLADGVKVGANTILSRSKIGERTIIKPYSMVEDAIVGADSFIGPYGRVRPGSILGDRAQIGNFVEIKNARIGSGCRINHLSFIGDADLAENVTIGAGTITCNYDGIGINRTVIENGAAIGSGSNLVAPLRIGTNATIGSGSTITSDVPADKLTLARSKQITKDNWQGPKTRRKKK